ncbi:hypothetical protein Poli38472_001985 [Pythium oligandrum]|uniref:DNA-directed RNA polymerase III subunit RPC9 n=1 Tax=Pythium oligandrum TaxID=41045 RepID=A0A8K1CV54_PYTOL|nr:hypothetical protein Poli38472_001985 [Pythium oligandrum]|eukprot:TMW69829.1 hypothetical protein Poli38472_001985 [Pythium oligandrum]
MKVLRINEGALTDYEVHQLLQERKEMRLHKAAVAAYAERNWMDHKVLKYLAHAKSARVDAHKVQDFLRQVEQAALPLTPVEQLQFINHCPTELVDVHLIVEDCAGRFTETQISELIGIVEATLASGTKQEDMEEEKTE